MMLIRFKMCVLSFLFGLFSARCLLGLTREWLSEIASRDTIIKELDEAKRDEGNIDSFDSSGKTGLMLAVGRADLVLVKAFLDAGADINMRAADLVGDTALHIACYNGNFPGTIPIIEYLIKYTYPYSSHLAANVSIRNKRGETALHHAAQISSLGDRRKVMEWLVERGADINAQDNNGTTVLHIAVNNKDDYGVQMLFDAFGGSLNTNVVNRKENKTPLEYARYLGFYDIAKRIEQNNKIK